MRKSWSTFPGSNHFFTLLLPISPVQFPSSADHDRFMLSSLVSRRVASPAQVGSDKSPLQSISDAPSLSRKSDWQDCFTELLMSPSEEASRLSVEPRSLPVENTAEAGLASERRDPRTISNSFKLRIEPVNNTCLSIASAEPVLHARHVYQSV